MAFAVLVIVMAVAGVISLQTAIYQRTASSEISETWLPSVTKSGEINLNVTRFRLAELDLVMAEDKDSQAAIKSRMEEYQQNLFIYLKVFEPLIRGEKQKKLFEEFSSLWDKYLEVHEKLLAAADAGRKEEAIQLLNSTDSQFENLSHNLSELSDESFTAGTKASEMAGQSFQTGKWISISLSASSMIIILMVGFLIRRDVRQRLGPIAVSTAESAMEVQNRVNILVHSSEQLSKVSVDSAASLEETVASMEELTAAVRVNAAHAKEAAELSQKSQSSVSQGQMNIQMMIENIKEVHQSSKKIGDILVLIEDISFQTNLLALNAAVEAARAGEQGRGFAVVADAVRSLAQKSAESAKEISQLITTSTQKTEMGVQYATRSEQSLAEIVDSVGKVGSLIQEISAAAQEQDAGISQVSMALSQIDQAIQGNASNTLAVSESSKSFQTLAESLNLMALRLNEFSGVGKVEIPQQTTEHLKNHHEVEESHQIRKAS
jgi:methyl-accepting chemotaxis protein